MPGSNLEIVRDAIARNSAAVVSLPSAGMLRNHKSRLLAEHDGGFLIEAIPEEKPLVDSLIASAQNCGVAFKSEHQKVIFFTKIVAALSQFSISPTLSLDVYHLSMPTEVKAIQRRANYRVRAPEDAGIKLQVWRMAPRVSLNDRPLPSASVAVELRDISIGGLGVRFLAKDGQPPKVSVEDRLRILLEWNEQSMLMEGQMRTPTAQNETGVTTGIRLRAAVDNLQFRQSIAILTRIVGELQRDEVRRFRLGLIQTAA